MIGGDKKPLEVLEYSIPGLKRVVSRYPKHLFVLAGPEDFFRECIPRSKYTNIIYLDCSDSHDNDGNVINIEGKNVKPKDDYTKSDESTSIVRLLKSEKENEIDAVFSSGNTGVLISNGGRSLGRIEGVYRAPMIAFIPTIKRGEPSVLLDVGVIIETTTPYMLYQYAIMGGEFYKIMFNVKEPIVKLLNVGEERTKGTEIHKVTYGLLESMKDEINFNGNIEGKKGIYLGKAHVIITDGLVGNMFIKGSEGSITDLVLPMLKDELTTNILGKLYVVPMKGSLKKIFKKMSPDKYNGALVLGLKKVLVKGHSTSNRFAFAHGLENTIRYLESDIISRIAEKFNNKDEQSKLMELYHNPYVLDNNKKIIVYERELIKSGEFSKEQIELAVNVLEKILKK